jgi:hypothetical protein
MPIALVIMSPSPPPLGIMPGGGAMPDASGGIAPLATPPAICCAIIAPDCISAVSVDWLSSHDVAFSRSRRLAIALGFFA